MALSTLRTNLSGLFKTRSDAGVVETPQLYLKLTTRCLNAISFQRVATQPKFNHEQCRYLLDKLKMAVQSAHSFLELINTWYSTFASDEDMVQSLEIFKLLLAIGMEVESIIQRCCKETWIQSAIDLANVSEYTASLGLNLELCSIVFSTRKKFASLRTLTIAQVADISVDEARVVKEKAHADEMRLIKDVSALIQSSKSGSNEWQLATFLFERMTSPSDHLSPAFQVSSQSSLQFSGNSIKNLEQLELLGEGSFGKVNKAKWLGAEVAAKTFREFDMSSFRKEVLIWGGLRHPNIVSFLWYVPDGSSIIMELMDGDLQTLIEKRKGKGSFSSSLFTLSEALDIMLQLAEGMYFLHEKRIVHRDLKARNILFKCVKAREVNVMYLHAKVADFGLSKTKEKSMTYSHQTANQGTSRWMAPEMIKTGSDNGEISQGEGQLKFPFKTDIYSFAMVCFEILTGNIPFATLNQTEVKRSVLAGGRPQLPDDCPNELRALIEACWSSEPSARPGFGEICSKLRHLKYSQLLRSAWAKVPRCFSLNAIMRMTNSFNKENLLSSWSVSSKSAAYKGDMVDRGEVITVLKVQDAGSTSSNLDHVKTELEVWPRLHHHKLVTFIGFCCEKGERIFVFEKILNHRMLGVDSYETGATDPIPALVWEANVETYLAHYMDVNMKDLIAFPLQLAKLVREGAKVAQLFQQECADLYRRVGKLIHLLQEICQANAKLTPHVVGLYERPTRRIMLEVVRALEIALERVRKCKRSGLTKRVMTITTSMIFRKVNLWLDRSIGDVTWLLNFSFSGDKHSDFAGLPPIASDDPVKAQVWEQVSILHVGTAEEKADGAEYLGTMAKDNERNVEIIFVEGGASPLLRLLGTLEGSTMQPVQEAAAIALRHLARDRNRVRQLRNHGASAVFTHILGSHPSSRKVQRQVARLVAKFASLDEEAQNEFASKGAIRLLVALLQDQTNTADDSEVQRGLKVEAARALRKLAAGNIKNCKLIADTGAFLCFARLMQNSEEDLKYNSVMAVMEIAVAAESDSEFRRAAFTNDSPSAKALVEQLLEAITRENEEPELQVLCCKAIGSLARIFPAPSEAPIRALISALANQNQDVIQVATAAASALSKFASDENYFCSSEHSKKIIAEGAVEHLVLLAVLNFHYLESQLTALELLCHLSLNVPDSEALARANVIHVLKSTMHPNQLSQSFARHKTTQTLINDAVAKLQEVYHSRSSSFKDDFYRVNLQKPPPI